MTLTLTAGQVDQLQLGNDDVVRILDVGLGDRETEYAVASTARLVDLMACHHFILETFPEVLEAIFNLMAFKLIHILDDHLVVSPNFDLQARHTFKGIPAALDLILIRIE